jgi:hypothetical protein
MINDADAMVKKCLSIETSDEKETARGFVFYCTECMALYS